MSSVPKADDAPRTVEETFAHAGAKIDQLISDAREAREALIAREENALKHSQTALAEIKGGLDKAWHELNLAWNEICKTVESKDPCGKKEEQTCGADGKSD
ncbi:MAG TPA: hypothetical protein PKN86_16455 [Candidatus Obscuribacter sp.]|nr:hypothetical protein [Candidatus Obscuribacter sp.]HMW91680.1 hypothetical protein [Candidatus Obscuribacter sp.]HMX44634.1 hypothetical protein [Candidatus Obscuribacter sp.]HMY55689.1 hypothetical protein [Candidatus Obscuribacter sp.]HNB14735.1 hypothetical protein [Candidatus Obscuribacter sp.]